MNRIVGECLRLGGDKSPCLLLFNASCLASPGSVEVEMGDVVLLASSPTSLCFTSPLPSSSFVSCPPLAELPLALAPFSLASYPLRAISTHTRPPRRLPPISPSTYPPPSSTPPPAQMSGKAGVGEVYAGEEVLSGSRSGK